MAFIKARNETGLVVTVEGEAEGCTKLILSLSVFLINAFCN